MALTSGKQVKKVAFRANNDIKGSYLAFIIGNFYQALVGVGLHPVDAPDDGQTGLEFPGQIVVALELVDGQAELARLGSHQRKPVHE
jgi:hypothetical protein